MPCWPAVYLEPAVDADCQGSKSLWHHLQADCLLSRKTHEFLHCEQATHGRRLEE